MDPKSNDWHPYKRRKPRDTLEKCLVKTEVPKVQPQLFPVHFPTPFVVPSIRTWMLFPHSMALVKALPLTWAQRVVRK